MKSLLAILFLLCNLQEAKAQIHSTHKPTARAKVLNDSAASLYRNAGGDEAKLQQVFKVLDAAIKADSLYYEPWSNKLVLYGQMDKFEEQLKLLKIMGHVFPKEEEVQFETGIVQYKTNRNKEALVTFNKLLQHYNALLEKNKNNGNTRGLLFNKAIVLILVDRENEGKSILTNLYDTEKDPMTKSGIAFYANNTKETIIEDKIPGK